MSNTGRRWSLANALGVVVSAATLTACAGAHLHNEGNAGEAKTVSEAFAASAKTEKENFDAQGKAFETLSEIDIASAARHTSQLQRAWIAHVAGSKESLNSVWLNKIFADRLETLGLLQPKDDHTFEDVSRVLKDAQPQRVAAASESRARYAKTRELILHEFKLAGAADGAGKPTPVVCTATKRPPDKVDTYDLDADHKARLESLYETLKRNCTDFQKVDLPKWYLQKQSEISSDREAALQAQKLAEQLLAAAATALKAVQESAESKTSAEMLISIGQRVKGVLETASEFEKAIFHETVFEDALKCVNQAMASLSGEAIADKDRCIDDDSAAVVAALPHMLDTAASIGTELNRPNLAGLQITKQVLEGQLAAAKARVAYEEAQVALQEERLENWRVEIVSYVELLGPLNNRAHQLGRNCSKADDVVRSVVAAQIVTNAGGELRDLEFEYRNIALTYSYALSLSRANAQSWRGMIDPLIAQQKAYHDSGITSKELAALILQIGQLAALSNIANHVGN